MKTLFADLYKSFFADKDGFSARKMSAFWAVVIVSTYLSVKHSDPANSVTIIQSWLVFGAACMGMVTAQQISDFKNGKKEP
jgi:hypothetical protein